MGVVVDTGGIVVDGTGVVVVGISVEVVCPVVDSSSVVDCAVDTEVDVVGCPVMKTYMI